MTLDQSLANLQQQADRLANLFASTADAIEKAGPPGIRIAKAISNAVVEPQATADGDHPHWGYANPETRKDTPPGVVAAADGSVINFEGENYVPQPALPAANYPAPTTEPSGNSEAPPWEAQAATEAEKPAEEKPAKKGGRRTNEELAADAGVDLDEVKAWLGEGKRVTKASIDEFAKLKASQNGQAQPAAEVPTEAASPFGGQPQAAPPYDNGGQPQAAPQAADPWPATAQPQFGTWPPSQQQGGFDPANPFGG